MKTRDFEPDNPLSVAVVGCGRMGRLHARALAQIPAAKLAGVFDVMTPAATALADELKVRAFDSLQQVIENAGAVVIATSTQHHAEVAEALVREGIACLIEKPLAANLAEARRIGELAERFSAIVQVGHIERFNPAFRAVEALGMNVRFMEVTRIGPLAFRALDVGVVMDVMIHDLDLILKIANSPLVSIDAKGVSVMGQHEDVCNARLKFQNGCVANVTASRIAMKAERRMRLFSREAFVSADFQKRQAAIARREGNLEAIRQLAAHVRRGDIHDLSKFEPASLIRLEQLAVEQSDPLRCELESFLAAAAGRSPVRVTVADAMAAIELAERIVQQIEPDMHL